MGVLLTPIITKETIALDALRGRTLAVDGNGELYQFLALIRLRDGTPLQDSKGRTTSHLSGIFCRTTRLMAEHALTLVFVFDARRRRARQRRSRSGVPTVQAPSEGEAQAAHMAASCPQVWAAASKDYDSLLFGAPRLVRFLTISGKEFLPSQATFRQIVRERSLW